MSQRKGMAGIAEKVCRKYFEDETIKVIRSKREDTDTFASLIENGGDTHWVRISKTWEREEESVETACGKFFWSMFDDFIEEPFD